MIKPTPFGDQLIENREDVMFCVNQLRARLDELSASFETYDQLEARHPEAAQIAFSAIAEAVDYQSKSVKVAASMLELEIDGKEKHG